MDGGPKIRRRRIELEEFSRTFGCELAPLPRNICLIGFSPARGWLLSGDNAALLPDRLPWLLRFLERRVRRHLPAGPFWFLCCLWDGWRERTEFSAHYRFVDAPDASSFTEWSGPPGAIPLLAPEQPFVACFSAHRGDPSALLLPDAHYLQSMYRPLRLRLALARKPWRGKVPQAIYCGSDYGETLNQLPPIRPERPVARRHLQQIVEAEALPVRVHLGQGVSLSEQLKYKYLLDVDGAVCTWDAWAWKSRSGSVVLYQKSMWETFFTRQFRPWEHYVPVENDFSDLGEKLRWCMKHDAECHAIAQRALGQARKAYEPTGVARRTAGEFTERLFTRSRPVSSPSAR